MIDNRTEAQKLAKAYNNAMGLKRYRHFKGGIYQVVFIGVHSETSELFVVYSDSSERIWIRPLIMFLSPVDKEKYPDVKQKFRFEEVE